MKTYLTKPAIILAVYSAAKASVTCLTGHLGAAEKQEWVTSQRMMCNALGRSRPVRARLQNAVTSTKSKKCKHMSLVILIC